MMRSGLLVGTGAFSFLVSVSCVAAQGAAPVAAAPQECSGLACLLGSRLDRPRPEEVEARHANEASALAAASAAAVVPAKAAKPAYQLTISARLSEIPRLKRLAAALPKTKIKIVAARPDASATDFNVSTDLATTSAEKAKLFTEQMHVVAGSNIQSLDDLEGKVVSFGPDKGATQAPARAAFEALNVRVRETPLDFDNALDGLATGDVDAVVMLAPQPIELLKTVSAPGAHFVSWPESGTLPTGAVASAIDAGAYPNLGKPGKKIRAMGVDATLNISAKGAKQSASDRFLKALSEHSETLSKRGFDLLQADLDKRHGRFVASAEKP